MRGFSFQPPIEASIAFLASAGFFLLTAAIPIRGDVVPIVLLGCVYVYVVVLAARWGGPLYAVPLAIAGGLGFDSFYPTHARVRREPLAELARGVHLHLDGPAD